MDIFERVRGMNPITSTFIYKRNTINVHPPAGRASIASYPIRCPYDVPLGSFCLISLCHSRQTLSNKLSDQFNYLDQLFSYSVNRVTRVFLFFFFFLFRSARVFSSLLNAIFISRFDTESNSLNQSFPVIFIIFVIGVLKTTSPIWLFVTTQNNLVSILYPLFLNSTR